MTSRDFSGRGPSDYQLNLLVRSALRERVAATRPSQATWQRIHTSARRGGRFWQTWNRLTYQFEAVGIWLSGADSAHSLREGWGTHWASAPIVRYDHHQSRLGRLEALRLVA